MAPSFRAYACQSSLNGTLKCKDHRTIALMRHASNSRCSENTVESDAEDSTRADVPMGFMKGVGTGVQISVSE